MIRCVAKDPGACNLETAQEKKQHLYPHGALLVHGLRPEVSGPVPRTAPGAQGLWAPFLWEVFIH